MLARSYSSGLLGVEGHPITVEAEVGLGLPGLTIVGRAVGALHEARERIRSALRHCGHEIRSRRQVVNLAPADLRKDSPGLDLAVAAALLGGHEIVPTERLCDLMLWGELGLDGKVRPVGGTLVVADAARRAGFRAVAVARASAAEAALIPDLAVLPVDDLAQLVAHLRGEAPIPAQVGAADELSAAAPCDVDLADVRGLPLARRALEVMVAGGHNLLLHGPPGVGKTMLARRAGTLFPRLDREAALEVTKIHGLRTRRAAAGLIEHAPVRTPHHTVTVAGLLGGGVPLRPGEVSLAHRGLLFLDELPEFGHACLEGMREPLEDGEVHLVRASAVVRFPARFQLMAAMNPCPCGYLGHPTRACTCPARAVARYQQRVSGPLMDRIDLMVPVMPIAATELCDAPPGEKSADVRERIGRARAVQARRFAGRPQRQNAEIPARDGAMDRDCPLTPGARRLLLALGRRRGLSPRALLRLRRVARTVADLGAEDAGQELAIDEAHVAEAAQLRRAPAREE